jgi:2-keto-4-pentenoate hydratase/2-oxohepta-3-ene-1,7-dioic acid hydratase in catechol pathway
MRLVTFRSAEGPRVGAVRDDRAVDLTAHMGVTSTKALIAGDHLGKAAEVARLADADLSLAEVELDLPVLDPAKILCVGVNYVDRNAEYKDGSEAPKYPSLFMRTPMSFVPHGTAIEIPPESEQLDYEGEIVLVIGRMGRRIARADALSHIAGLTIMNEGSIRDWLRHGKFNVTQGKNFDRTGGLGPWIECDLSNIDLADMSVRTWVNGELRQADTTANMAFPFDRIIEYVSTFTTLLPGDLIATGTPSGAGARFDPPRWLKAGDMVEVEVEGVGRLVNPVIEEGRRCGAGGRGASGTTSGIQA